jgi:hypothetical protein
MILLRIIYDKYFINSLAKMACLLLVFSSNCTAQTQTEVDIANQIKNHATNLAKELNEQARKSDVERRTRFPMRVRLSESIFTHPLIWERYQRHLGVSMLSCYQELLKPEDLLSKKHHSALDQLSSQIGDQNGHLKRLLDLNTEESKEIIAAYVNRQISSTSEETLAIAVKLLNDPISEPIVLSWAAASISVNLSCYAKTNTEVETPEERIYKKILQHYKILINQ